MPVRIHKAVLCDRKQIARLLTSGNDQWRLVTKRSVQRSKTIAESRRGMEVNEGAFPVAYAYASAIATVAFVEPRRNIGLLATM